ncbi:MAG: DUF4445 domain-containing protein [Candidatus Abyssobacteria bacterium SURF_17]|uniref:DUF4445 domain-containing protein n=1 Tax=Candidatus Abyssobacteria bacterium SURF_17 TaxID=2093361 RepID=A0A419EXG3_9BACT|nr:MAG: DUF4445 domain-containing protein [Candidatus Abyssubacteria bacterium SURF_17]
MKCTNHPDRDATFRCAKDDVYLCHECLNCRNPDIYCKYRTSCIIWEMQKYGEAELAPVEKPSGKTFRVRFLPDNKEVLVKEGQTIFDAVEEAGIFLNNSCGGRGICGKCKVRVEEGKYESASNPYLTAEEIRNGYSLACATRVTDDLVVTIPLQSQRRKMKILDEASMVTSVLCNSSRELSPLTERVSVDLPPPTIEDSSSDLDRVVRVLRHAGHVSTFFRVDLPVIRKLGETLRKNNWRAILSLYKDDGLCEIVGLKDHSTSEQGYGVAIDVGTTSVVTYLVDLSDGKIVASASSQNAQAAFGEDVISRIVCTQNVPGCQEKLHRLIVGTLEGLLREIVASASIAPADIDSMCIAGNTTMIHLLLHIDPQYIRREPYLPTATTFPALRSKDIGLSYCPHALVHIVPGNTAYVGGDIVAGILASEMHKDPRTTLFIDVGTNGEIVLGNSDWLMTASCSAGPAFEGGGIRCGMRAEEGAIEHIEIDPLTLRPTYEVNGDAPPRGICGSGMIDLLAAMLEADIIDRRGRFREGKGNEYVRQNEAGFEYVLVHAKESALGEDIVFTQADVDTLMRSKAAIYAGFATLLSRVGLSFEQIDRVMIAGGFGRYIKIPQAIAIGMLPDMEHSKFHYLGNTAIKGAYQVLLCRESRDECNRIASMMTYIDFSTSQEFMDQYSAALFLPHTNLQLFPSAQNAADCLGRTDAIHS